MANTISLPNHEQEYVINGVRYFVNSVFSTNEKCDNLSQKFQRYIGSNFADLNDFENNAIIDNEYVTLTAGKEDYYRFVGVVELPSNPQDTNVVLEARQGVAVEYLTA